MEENVINNPAWPSEELICPSCNYVIKYYDKEGSSFFCCSECHTFFEKDGNSPPRIIKKYRTTVASSLPIGTVGKFDGKEFIVSGLIQKHDAYEGISWKEYMLFNPSEEYYYVLAEVDGDWYLIWKAERDDFVVMNTNVMAEEYVAMISNPYEKYDHYASYIFTIEYAEGEFDTDILDDQKKLKVEEYIDPPNMLASETLDGQTLWYRGRFVPFHEMWEVFNIDFSNPTGAKQFFKFNPIAFHYKWPVLRFFSMVMVILLLLVQLVLGNLYEPRRILDFSFTVAPPANSSSKPTPIDAGIITLSNNSALNFHFDTDVYNQWVEVSVSVINKATGRSYEFTKVAEYYAGYEDGEHWTEGSSSADAVLSNLPAGSYQINVYPATESLTSLHCNMQVEKNTILYSNMFWALLAILAYPGILMLRNNNFNNRRFD